MHWNFLDITVRSTKTGQKTGSQSGKFFPTKVAEFNNMFDGLIKFMIFQGHIRNFTKVQNGESHNNNWVAVKTSLKINLARSKMQHTCWVTINDVMLCSKIISNIEKSMQIFIEFFKNYEIWRFGMIFNLVIFDTILNSKIFATCSWFRVLI